MENFRHTFDIERYVVLSLPTLVCVCELTERLAMSTIPKLCKPSASRRLIGSGDETGKDPEGRTPPGRWSGR